jgi:hypothetical protein
MAGVSPITQNPIPDWATDADLCLSMDRGCDACNTTEYCKYTANGSPMCCSRGSSGPAVVAAEEPPMAGVAPIVEDPIPVWASNKDKCKNIGSCDDCPVGGKKMQYCKYVDSQPKCCKHKAL